MAAACGRRVCRARSRCDGSPPVIDQRERGAGSDTTGTQVLPPTKKQVHTGRASTYLKVGKLEVGARASSILNGAVEEPDYGLRCGGIEEGPSRPNT